jgi:hypothetical protein
MYAHVATQYQEEAAARAAEGAQSRLLGVLYQTVPELWAVVTASEAAAAAQYQAQNGGVAAAAGFSIMGQAAAGAAADVWKVKEAIDALNNQRTGNYGSNARTITPLEMQESRARTSARVSDVDDYYEDERRQAFALDQQQRRFAADARDRALAEVEARRNISAASRGSGRAATAAGRESSAAARSSAREHEKAANDIRQAYEQNFNKVQGYVANALSFNENVGERDALLDQFGLRNQNASDELIRQLADIRDRASEGTRSPWLDFFPELDAPTMAEIEARAESLMRSLKSGLRRDLLDPEAVKADVRERIAADRAAEEFNRQIAQQLIAEGAGSKAEIQNALASSLGLASVGAGEIASEQLVDTMAKGILESVEASASLFAQAGELMGDHIKSGLRTKFKDIAEELATMIIESVEEQA